MGAPIPQATTPGSQDANGSTASPSSSVPEAHLSTAGIEASLGFLDELLTGDKPDKKGKAVHVNGKLMEASRAGVQWQVGCCDGSWSRQ